MSTYAPPLEDMRFAIEELVGLDSIGGIPAFSGLGSDVVGTILEQAGRFATGVLDPLNRVGDREGVRLSPEGRVVLPHGFEAAYRQFVDGGWCGLSADAGFGGQGLPQLVGMPVQEIWSSANLAFCMCPLLTAAVADVIALCGSPDQQRDYLPRLISGDWAGTMNLTESQAGSDLSAVQTRAVPEGGHYRIHGNKIFITWGEQDITANILHLVLARTPGAPDGVKGLSLFIVPKYLDGQRRNEVRCLSVERKLGVHGSPTCVLEYGGNEGAIGYRVGDENRGLEYMFVLMNQARLGVGIEGVGLAERACQHALAYAKSRVQGRAVGRDSAERVTLIHHPDVRRMLLAMKSQTEAMRGLAYAAAALLDVARCHPDAEERKRADAQLGFLTPVVKGWCTERCVEIASTAIQVFGGAGFVEDSGAAQYLRDARVTTIYEGTTGIQAADLVGRKIARDRGAAALAMINELRRVGAALGNGRSQEIAAIRLSYEPAVAALARATDWLLATIRGNPNAVMAVSVPYLELCGTVLGGSIMARSALLARARLDGSHVDAHYCKGKLATAHFYAANILPRALALAEQVQRGAESVLAVEASDF